MQQRSLNLWLAAGVLTLVAAACGGDHTPPPAAIATPTTAPSPTPTVPPPTPTATAIAPTPQPVARAQRVTDSRDLIGGPLARGRIGDYLIANDKIRVVVRDVGRNFAFAFTYGGNIIDADLVRAPGDPDRDSFEAMTPLINLSSTTNVQSIEVLNDGTDGNPAIIRTLGVDDLFDAIDPTNAILGFGVGGVPAAAHDKDLPVSIMTEYSLAPGDAFVRITTTIKNDGGAPLDLYVGDYVSGSGELDQFVPGLGFGEVQLRLTLPLLGYAGLGQATGVSYGVIPADQSSALTNSGITAYLAGQNLASVLLTEQPGALHIDPGATNSYERAFVVGHGDIGSLEDVRNGVQALATGTLRGQVTSSGQPIPDATVSIVVPLGVTGNQFNVIDALRTDANGRFEGTVPVGAYKLMAKAAGYPYDSATTQANRYPVTIVAGVATTQDVQLPATGTVRVLVRDADGNPLPAKVSVVGFDRSPDPGNLQSIAGLELTGAVFGTPIKEQGRTLFGVARVLFAGVDGDTSTALLEPDEYQVVVSHGPAYSAFAQRITVAAGIPVTVTATLARVIDSEGFVSADFHVHLINSPDCAVTKDERLATMLAEGVDYFVASDHDFRTDLRPDLERLHAGGRLAVGVSEEISPFNIGHFNAWPLPVDPSSRTGGALDWGRAGVPAGLDYPSLGSYDLSPAEIFAAVPADSVKQINHVNSPTLGFLTLAGVDTALKPPQSFTDPAAIRQNPAISNLYDEHYTALELWIEGSRAQTALLFDANLGDWFNLLNQGQVKTGTADSDTHHTAAVHAGGPRNFVASVVDDPRQLSDTELAHNVTDGRVIGSNAPFVRVSLEGDGGETAGLALGQPRLVRATSGSVKLQVRAQSPLWAEFDTVEIYVNTVPEAATDVNLHGVVVPRYAVRPSVILQAGVDFAVTATVINSAVPGASRLEASISKDLQVPRDSWVVVVVRGTDGVSKPLWPMNPQDLNPETNKTLDDLTDGNLGEGGQPAVAFTNPLFVDVDGNGRFDPPL